MAKILIVCSTSRFSEGMIDDAFLHAQRDPEAEIFFLYIIETGDLSSVYFQMRFSGFLGKKPTEKVIRAILMNRKWCGRMRRISFERRAKMINVPVQIMEVTGEYSNTVLEHLERKAYDNIYMVEEKQFFLSRLVHKPGVDRVVQFARKNKGTEIRLVEK